MKSALDHRTVNLLIESAEWRALGLLFESPTDAWRTSIEGLAPSIRKRGLRAAVDLAMQEASVPDYYSLAGPGGPVPLREASYRHTLELGYLLAEVEAFYKAFAFTPESDDPVDHLAVEAAFISYLRMKEAYAVLSGAGDEAEITREAAEDFIRQHLVYFAEPLHQHVKTCGIEYLARATEMLRERVGAPPASLPVLDNLDSDESSCDPTNGC